eukprot:scaffold14.g1136.t1
MISQPPTVPGQRLEHGGTGIARPHPPPQQPLSSTAAAAAAADGADEGTAAVASNGSAGEAVLFGSAAGAVALEQEPAPAAVALPTAAQPTSSGGAVAVLSSSARPRAGSSMSMDEDDDKRWADSVNRALMESLQAPRAEHPSWWGERYHKLQARMAELLESREAHYLVIGLVLFDLAIVLTELVLSSFFPSQQLAPHIGAPRSSRARRTAQRTARLVPCVHVAEEALSWTSIGILALFTSELVAKLLVWHMFDATIVVISFTLELSLKGVAQEVASLLIFFRLWRIMRIMHGVAEAMELNHTQELHKHQHEIVHLQSELAVARQRSEDLQQQVGLLNVAAAAKGLDLHTILSTAAAQQQQLAATAQQQLLTAAAATASKGLDLQNILTAAAAQQQHVTAIAQAQLLAAAAAAAAAGGGSATSHATAAAAAAAAVLPQAHADLMAKGHLHLPEQLSYGGELGHAA